MNSFNYNAYFPTLHFLGTFYFLKVREEKRSQRVNWRGDWRLRRKRLKRWVCIRVSIKKTINIARTHTRKIRKKSKNCNPRINPLLLADFLKESESDPKNLADGNYIIFFSLANKFKTCYYFRLRKRKISQPPLYQTKKRK